MKKITKGIIMAGGSGSRLYPLTQVVSKHLLPVYDKPMLYYPLTTLMFLGVREFLIVSTPEDIPRMESLLGDGSHWGVSFRYKVQDRPGGIAEAFRLGEEFIGNDSVALILGDNIFHGHDLPLTLRKGIPEEGGAAIFAYSVSDPERYGIVELDRNGNAISLEEKPARPRSTYAVTGLYVYDANAVKYARDLKPSGRGELEITDINKEYLKQGRLKVNILGRGFAWLDAGTPDSLMAAGEFIRTIELRQGLKVACPEEIAFRLGFITRDELAGLAGSLKDGNYAAYLNKLLEQNLVYHDLDAN